MSAIFEFLTASPLRGALLVGMLMGLACSVYIVFMQLTEYGNTESIPLLALLFSLAVGVLGFVVLFQLGLGLLFDGKFLAILMGLGLALAGFFGIVLIVYRILRGWKIASLSRKEITQQVLALIDEHKPERIMVCNDGVVLVNGGNPNFIAQKKDTECFDQGSFDRAGGIHGYTSYRSFCKTSYLTVCATVDFAASGYPYLNATLMELFSRALTQKAKGYSRRSADQYATYTKYTSTGETYYVSNGVVKGGPGVTETKKSKLIDCYYVLINKEALKHMENQKKTQSARNSW